MTRRTLIGLGALVLGLLVVFALGTWAAFEFTVDDAYITFRYSEHLADGHGPVFNVDGDPVEGFTNFGWMLLFSLFAALDWDLDTVAKIFSALVGGYAVGMLVRHGYRFGGWPAAVVAGAAFVVFLPTYFHVGAGLETVVFAVVVLRAAVVGLEAVRGDRIRPWEPALLALVAGLLRPEGVLVAAVPLGFWLWRCRRDRVAWFWTALAAAVGIGYFGWRWAFYGHPLPNTFYVKFGDLDSGLEWVGDTAVVLGPLVVLTAVLLVSRRTRASGALLLGMVAATYATYALSGPTMDYLHRFAFHAYPVLCFGGGLGIGLLAATMRDATRLRRTLPAVGGAVAVAWVGLWGTLSEQLPLIANYGVDLQRTHVAVGQALAATDVPREFRSVAVSDAGAVPYFSGWETLDYLGLNNEAVAHGADPTAVVRETRPTMIIATSYGPYQPRTAYGLRVAEATAGYEYVGRAQMRDGYWQHYFVLPRWSDEVAAAVEEHLTYAQARNDPGRYDSSLQRWFDRLGPRWQELWG